jgi:hypothetical protein
VTVPPGWYPCARAGIARRWRIVAIRADGTATYQGE